MVLAGDQVWQETAEGELDWARNGKIELSSSSGEGHKGCVCLGEGEGEGGIIWVGEGRGQVVWSADEEAVL